MCGSIIFYIIFQSSRIFSFSLFDNKGVIDTHTHTHTSFHSHSCLPLTTLHQTRKQGMNFLNTAHGESRGEGRDIEHKTKIGWAGRRLGEDKIKKTWRRRGGKKKNAGRGKAGYRQEPNSGNLAQHKGCCLGYNYECQNTCQQVVVRMEWYIFYTRDRLGFAAILILFMQVNYVNL